MFSMKKCTVCNTYLDYDYDSNDNIVSNAYCHNPKCYMYGRDADENESNDDDLYEQMESNEVLIKF